MRIQSKTGRSLVSRKLAGAIFAVFALFVQPLVALDVPSAFAATTINEVMANPVEVGEVTTEWIELKNNDDTAADISGWTIAGATVPAGQTIAADGLYVLCATVEATADCDGVSTTNMTVPNEGTQTLELKSDEDEIIDTFTYAGTEDGQSIEVVKENGTSSGVNNTTDSYETNQTPPQSGNTGTPGAKNTNQPTVVKITSVAELRSAIMNQKDGQTWNIAAGQYGLSPFNSLTVSGQTGWYFPITADNLTIEGEGNPTIYGTGHTANGNWATQNLVSVFGDNVTIDGFTFMPKVQPNKTVEVLGDGFTLRNTVFMPNSFTDQSEYTDAEDAEWGGSLYFSHAGNHQIENVTIHNGGISYRYSPAGTHIAFSGVTLANSTNVDWINSYRYSSGFNEASNTITGAPVVEYHVNSALNNLQQVLDTAKAGDVVSIDSDLTLSAPATIKSGITLNGNGNTVSAGSALTNAVFTWSAVSGITISNLTVDGSGKYVHGIKAFKGSADLNDVTIQNAGKHGLQVNSANVTVDNFTTLHNAWGGVEVAQNNASSTLPAVFTVSGVSNHTEAGPEITITDATKLATVVDTDSQYSTFEYGNTRVYTLSSELSDGNGGAVTLPVSGGVATTPTNHSLELSLVGGTTAVIPADTTITSSDSSWDGTITSPTASAYEVPGNSSMTSYAISVGSDTSSLTFDQGVRLVLPDQAGKRVGFITSGSSTFTEITATCAADNQATGNALGVAGTCKIDSGSDLVIWTKHFTTFATYTIDITKPTGSFTAPVANSTHKGLVDVSANAADSETGLKNLQIVLRNSSNAVAGNWTYNVQTNTANTIAGSGTVSFSGDSASGTLAITDFNTASLATGTYNLRMFTTDVAGNSNSAIYNSFYVDNSAPDGSIAAFADEQKGNTTVTVDLSEVGTAGLGQQQLVMRDADGSVVGNWTYNVATDVSNTISGPNATFAYTGDETSGQLKITFDSSSLDNGSYSLRLFTKDQLGTGRSNIYGSVKFDNEMPTVSFDSPAAGSTVQDLTIGASLSGTGSNITQYGFDVTGPNGLHFSTPNYQVDQSTVTITDLDLCSQQYYGDDCPTILADGTYIIRAKVYDNAGNRNISTYLTLIIDGTAPVVDAGPDQNVSSHSATLNGGSDNATSYEWTLLSGSGTASFVDASAASTSVTVTAYGTYEFQLKATDAVGNSSTDVVSVAFTQPIVVPADDDSIRDLVAAPSRLANTAVQSSPDVASAIASEGVDNEGDVLGTNTEEKADTPIEKVAALAPSEQGWKLWGISWYWWLLALAVLGTGSWYAARLHRNRKADF